MKPAKQAQYAEGALNKINTFSMKPLQGERVCIKDSEYILL